MPETLFGASFCAISFNHPLAVSLSKKNSKIKDFIEECRKGSTTEEDLENYINTRLKEDCSLDIYREQGYTIPDDDLKVNVLNNFLVSPMTASNYIFCLLTAKIKGCSNPKCLINLGHLLSS